MLGWALVFLVVALIAGLLGFTGLAVASAGIAQILFYIFVVLFVVSSLINKGVVTPYSLPWLKERRGSSNWRVDSRVA